MEVRPLAGSVLNPGPFDSGGHLGVSKIVFATELQHGTTWRQKITSLAQAGLVISLNCSS